MPYIVKVPFLDLGQGNAHIYDQAQYGPPVLYFIGETPDIANRCPRFVSVPAASLEVSVTFV